MDDKKDPSKNSDYVAQEFCALCTEKDFNAEEDVKVAPRYAKVDGQDTLFLLVKETGDSLFVVCPMSLSYVQSSPILQDSTPTCLVRIFKTSVSFLSRPSHKDLVWYLFSLAQKFESEPEFFTEERKGNILALLSILADQQGLPDLTKMKVSSKNPGVTLYEIDRKGQEVQLDDLPKTDLAAFTPLLRSTRKH